MQHWCICYSDILQDYIHEFHKTKANFMAIQERENLMGSLWKDIESYKSGSGVNNRRNELFLNYVHLRKSSDKRNNKHCYGNKRKYDFTERNVEVNSQQNVHFDNHFPAVNSLIQRINLRKQWDSLFLGGVIGVCTTTLLLYASHWWDSSTDSQ